MRSQRYRQFGCGRNALGARSPQREQLGSLLDGFRT